MKAKKFIKIVKKLAKANEQPFDIEAHPEQGRINDDRALAKAFKDVTMLLKAKL